MKHEQPELLNKILDEIQQNKQIGITSDDELNIRNLIQSKQDQQKTSEQLTQISLINYLDNIFNLQVKNIEMTTAEKEGYTNWLNSLAQFKQKLDFKAQELQEIPNHREHRDWILKHLVYKIIPY